jgi:putative endonuclease
MSEEAGNPSKPNPAELGKQGEQLAAEHMESLGLNVVHRNWRNRHLEIDLIAENATTVIFVEVKTRSFDYLEQPFEAVKKNKRTNLIKAADFYMRERDSDKEFRFDIISIVWTQKGPKLEHIEDAFYPTA